MLNYNLPLTEAESEFAAEHHSVIYGYLRKAGLPEDDFYDVVVFGYLRAVRKYLARPELRKYSFSTIAYRAMSCDVHHSKEYWMRKKRRALVHELSGTGSRSTDIGERVRPPLETDCPGTGDQRASPACG